MADFEAYSDAKKRLEQIAAALEENDITLEKSMELYEEGARLVALCYDKLSNAKLKFTTISNREAKDGQ
ncbi:MAG: exodeoxyribonuclease VII small subunit [Clostridia bacterium]|nr:exodeoxyribonuclease VII small subunit [Clostridia bacterium]